MQAFGSGAYPRGSHASGQVTSNLPTSHPVDTSGKSKGSLLSAFLSRIGLSGIRRRGSSSSMVAARYYQRDSKKSLRIAFAIVLVFLGVVTLEVPWISFPTGPDDKVSPWEKSEVSEASEAETLVSDGADTAQVRSEGVKVFGDPSLGISYGEANVEDATKWVLYNKPWKTGSTGISNLLGDCLGLKDYTEVKFNWMDSDDIINPVTPALDFSEGKKHFSVQHGRYNIAELRDLKQRSTYRNCYVTSVREPIERIPSNAIQLVDGSVTFKESYKKSSDEMQKLVCAGLEHTNPQYMAHYMVGMHWNREMNLTTEQTVRLAKEVVATYDIILDKTGATLYDSLNPACDETRQCLESQPEKMNSKLGDTNVQYDCKEAMDRLVGEENKFFMGIIGEIQRINTQRM